MRAQVTSGYALDKIFWPEKFGRSYPKCGVSWSVAPCRFATYLRGDSSPSELLQNLVEKRFPGTKIWMHLPLYGIMRDPPVSLGMIEDLLRATHPIVAQRLFFTLDFIATATPQRRHNYRDAIKAFDREGDTVALTACLGMVRQAQYTGELYWHSLANRAAYSILLRHVFHEPWLFVRYELFSHLVKHFFSFDYAAHIPNWTLRTQINTDFERFEKQMALRGSLALLMEDIGLLGPSIEEHRACMYAAEEIGIVDVFVALNPLYMQDDWAAAKRHPLAKQVVARIRKNGVTPDDLIRTSFCG